MSAMTCSSRLDNQLALAVLRDTLQGVEVYAMGALRARGRSQAVTRAQEKRRQTSTSSFPHVLPWSRTDSRLQQSSPSTAPSVNGNGNWSNGNKNSEASTMLSTDFNGWLNLQVPSADGAAPSLDGSLGSAAYDQEVTAVFDDTDDGYNEGSFISDWWSTNENTQRLPELWETLRLAITTVAVPLGMSTLIRIVLVAPLLGSLLNQNPSAFELTEHQRDEVAQQVSKEHQRLWYEGVVGRAPLLSDEQMNAELQRKARELEADGRRSNCKAYENFVADFVTTGIIFSGAISYRERIADLWRSFAFHFTSMQSATQAFILLLLSDVAVGYHSADGWITVCRLLLSHYGLPENEDLISIFVAVVPVSLDVSFKYWVFKWLQSVQPSTKLILSEIDSH